MALDESKETDHVVEFDGVAYFVDRDLSTRTGDITIDMIEMGGGSGITVTSTNIVAGCGACSC